MSLGYIGLGNMGGPIAARLQRQQPIYVLDPAAQAVTRLTALGAVACTSLRDLAARCDTILLCLPTSDHVHTVIFGSDGIAASAKPGTLIIDQTTGAPSATRAMAADLAARGLDLIDAPVSGGPEGAEAGAVVIMVGASPTQFAQAEPVLRAISSNVFHAGDVGAGHVIKLAKNLLSAGHRLLSLEAVALAAKNGVEPQMALEIMLASTGRNVFLERTMGSRILSGKLASGSTLGQLHKDVRLACDLGAESGVPALFGNLIKEMYQVCINEMGASAQVNAAALVIDRLSGTQVVPPDYVLE
jgi:3-hydroxyisobutyrate dehydrogenase